MSQSQERENNINKGIEAALELFISDSISSTGINRIAKECGLAPMSIYRYFGTKDGLVVQVWRHALERFFSRYMEQYSALSGCNGYEKL